MTEYPTKRRVQYGIYEDDYLYYDPHDHIDGVTSLYWVHWWPERKASPMHQAVDEIINEKIYVQLEEPA